MHTTTLLPLTLLALPLLAFATPQDPNPAPANPQPNSTAAQPTTTLSPDQLAQFDAKYASLASAATTDPAYAILASNLAAASIPTPLANAQEASYIAALRTATGSVPEPAYITNLPEDQQSWIRGFHQQIAPAAPTSSAASTASASGVLPPVASVNGTQVGNATQIVNDTAVTADPQAGAPTPQATLTSAMIPPQPSVTDAANGTNGTSGAMRLGEGRGGLFGMVGMGFLGVVVSW
ncbi:MAG: hypothetical protein Q9221_004783 [Calogaya cf. arnoldii]